MLTNVLKIYPLTCLCTIAIVLLSVLPFPEVPQLVDVPLVDKWVHFIMYGGWSLTCWFEMSRSERKTKKRKATSWLLFYGMVCSALLGGLLELVQAYCTTTRSGDFWDFIADSIGAVLGTVLGAGVRRLVWKS